MMTALERPRSFWRLLPRSRLLPPTRNEIWFANLAGRGQQRPWSTPPRKAGTRGHRSHVRSHVRWRRSSRHCWSRSEKRPPPKRRSRRRHHHHHHHRRRRHHHQHQRRFLAWAASVPRRWSRTTIRTPAETIVAFVLASTSSSRPPSLVVPPTTTSTNNGPSLNRDRRSPCREHRRRPGASPPACQLWPRRLRPTLLLLPAVGA